MRTPRASCPVPSPVLNCERLCLRCLVVRTCAAGRSSPSNTTGTCAATPCWPNMPTAACYASTSQPAAAYRNVAVTGATPVAVTNCLNFGSPEDPGVMWQFAQAVRGLADGCAALGIPVTGGKVSFFKQTGNTP